MPRRRGSVDGRCVSPVSALQGPPVASGLTAAAVHGSHVLAPRAESHACQGAAAMDRDSSPAPSQPAAEQRRERRGAATLTESTHRCVASLTPRGDRAGPRHRAWGRATRGWRDGAIWAAWSSGGPTTEAHTPPPSPRGVPGGHVAGSPVATGPAATSAGSTQSKPRAPALKPAAAPSRRCARSAGRSRSRRPPPPGGGGSFRSARGSR
jgi:hypothetical protein